MSCSSPFMFSSELTYSSQPYNLSFSGSTTVPGYTTASVPLCVLAPVCVDSTCGPGCSCNKHKCGGWNPGNIQCWSWCKCCTQTCTAWKEEWTDCTTVPGIQLWPDLNVSASITVPMSFELATGVSITVEGGEPIECASITFNSFDFVLDINGVKSTIKVPVSLTVSEENGSFAVTIPITSISETYHSDGYTYNLNFSFNLLTCLTPSGGAGWLNFQVACSINVDGIKTNFDIACPIIEAEEVESPAPDA